MVPQFASVFTDLGSRLNGGAAFVLARRSIVDIPTAAIAIVTFAALTKLKKAPEPLVILAAGAVGLVVKAVTSL